MTDLFSDLSPAKRRCYEFVAKLEKATDGDKAMLKRNAGKTLSQAHNIPPIFWQSLPYGISHRQEELYFLVATLFPFVKYSHGLDYDPPKIRNFGHTLKRIRDEQNKNGLNRRFTILLDADEQQLPFRLHQLVARLKSTDDKSITLNWAELLYHLTNWHSEDRWVQLHWARNYFTNQSTNKK